LTYQTRTYRKLHKQHDLTHFQLAIKETDLDIAVPHRIDTAKLRNKLKQMVQYHRSQLEAYIKLDPAFATSLQPYGLPPEAPEIIQEMANAAEMAGVGPMAAVAGAFSQYLGRALESCPEVIIENGGDIYIKSTKKRNIAIFAGTSPFSNKIALEISPKQTPLGICTSSGTVGHSLSFGKADAVVIIAPSVPLADAVATAAANMVQHSADLLKAVDFATSITGIYGAVAILGDQLAVKGKVKLKPLT
jgi:ApbE superfamily uncharacterized protein (UPF0280 family)